MAKRRRQTPNPDPSRARASTGAGRPHKCTPKVVEALARLIAVGVPIAVACGTQGIGKTTLTDWRHRAARGVEPYASLMPQIDTAQSRAVTSVTMQLVKAGQRDWRAAAWWLERRAPEQFSLTQTVRVEPGPTELTDEELDAAMAAHGFVRAPRQHEDYDS